MRHLLLKFSNLLMVRIFFVLVNFHKGLLDLLNFSDKEIVEMQGEENTGRIPEKLTRIKLKKKTECHT